MLETTPSTSPAAGLVTWRFSSATLVRARRVAQLEATFDADPYLAAMTTDLMEEVARLRRRLRHLEEGTPTAQQGAVSGDIGASSVSLDDCQEPPHPASHVCSPRRPAPATAPR